MHVNLCLFLILGVYQEVCLTLNALTFSVTMFDGLLCHFNIFYMSQCARKQQHLLFSLISFEGRRLKKKKSNVLVGAEELATS